MAAKIRISEDNTKEKPNNLVFRSIYDKNLSFRKENEHSFIHLSVFCSIFAQN